MTDDQISALLPGVYYMDPPDGGNVTLLEQLQRMAKDAERYRWLRSRVGLELREGRGTWRDRYGTWFVATHYLSEGGTQHAPAPSLDETIDAAMAVAAEREGRK